MKLMVRVRVDVKKLGEFAQKLMFGKLDRSCIRGDTFCIKDDPSVGYSVWEVSSREEFELKFGPWRPYYTEVEVREVISPLEAMSALTARP